LRSGLKDQGNLQKEARLPPKPTPNPETLSNTAHLQQRVAVAVGDVVLQPREPSPVVVRKVKVLEPRPALRLDDHAPVARRQHGAAVQRALAAALGAGCLRVGAVGSHCAALRFMFWWGVGLGLGLGCGVGVE